MADNLNITSGAGVVVATDDISSVHYQRIKLVDGNLDSTNPTGVNANPLIVNVLNTRISVTVSGGVTLLSSSTVTVSGSITALTTGTVTAVVTGGITLVSAIPLNIEGTVLVSGGVTILSSSAVTVSGSVTALVTGTVTSIVSGGVTLLSSSAVTVSGSITSLVTGTVTAIVSGGVTLLSASAVTVSGGVTLLSSASITAKRDVINYIGCTPTWIYAALSSANQTILWTPAANKRFNITDITVNTLTSASILLTQDTAATITIMKLQLAAQGGWSSNLQTPYSSTQTNHALAVTSSAAGTNSYISVSGYES